MYEPPRLLLTLLALSTMASAQTTPPTAPQNAVRPASTEPATPTLAISNTAADYLNAVIDVIQRNALHKNEINWTLLRSDAIAHAAGAQTSTDTYPAIFYVFTQLKEHHSFLRIPDSLPDADKKRTWAAYGAIVGPYAKRFPAPPASPFSKRADPNGHMIHAGDHDFAWVSIPVCGGKHSNWSDNLADFQAYADKLHSIAAGLAAQHPAGWIVDLRGNGGGNMWPMLAGIGFILGDGTAGSFVTPDGATTDWSYKEGKAYDGSGPDNVSAFVNQPPLSLPQLPAVAVLIDSGTASSGEAIAVSFAGRPQTRFFGTHTYGLSSSNQMYTLSDGASLFLNNAVDADRNHRRYDNGLEPDVAFPEPATLPDESTDPVLQAAESWLTKMSL